MWGKYLVSVENIQCIFAWVNSLSNGRFLERKIWNPFAYVADRLKKLRGSGQPYLVNVNIVLM